MEFSANEIAVLRAIYSLEMPTRKAISHHCSMSLGLTSSVLGALLTNGTIDKTDKYTPSIGHPSSVFGINPAIGFSIGIAVDIASVRIVAVDVSKNLIAVETFLVDVMSADPSTIVHIERDDSRLLKSEQPVFIRNLILLCDDFLQKNNLSIGPLLSIGLGLPGAVNPRMGVWIRGLRVAGIEQVKIRESISGHYHVPVSIDDIARTISIYEKTLGLGRGLKNIVVLHLSEGVGAGAIVAGALYQGHRGLSVEIGHISVNSNGYRCICGNIGCLETIASTQGILRFFADRIREVGPSALIGHHFSEIGELSMATILKAAREGDSFTRSNLFEIGSYLGEACSNLVFLYDPEQIIISGTGAVLGEYFIDAMRQSMAKRISASLYQDLALVFSHYEPTHESFGAALIATAAYWDETLDGRR